MPQHNQTHRHHLSACARIDTVVEVGFQLHGIERVLIVVHRSVIYRFDSPSCVSRRLTVVIHLRSTDRVACSVDERSRMMDVILLQAMRSTFTRKQKHKPSWLGALLDPSIGRAIVMIHKYLSDPLTIDALAHESGMSRSAFAARFAHLLDEPPMSYVARWRMNRASHLLRATDDKIAKVAARVGYDSTSALTKAFKQHLGLSPGAYRHHFLAANRGVPNI